MAAEIIMPQLGETVAEGKIVTWFKKVGDVVKSGDRLFEVETDKVTIDVEAIEGGILTAIMTGDGEIAPIGQVVAVLDGAAVEPLASKPVDPAPGGNAGHTAAAQNEGADENRRAAAVPMSVHEEVRTPNDHFGKALIGNDIRMTPLARRLISQNGLDAAKIAEAMREKGASKISERDVRAAIAMRDADLRSVQAGASPDYSTDQPVRLQTADIVAGTGEEKIAFSTIRQKTADRLAENWRSIPHVFQAIEVDFTAIDRIRGLHKEAFKAATGLSLTYLPFITRAVALALREFPHVNAKTDGRNLVVCRDINIGIAVDLSHKGLVVPVLRNADELTVTGIAKGIGRLVDKARTGKLSIDDMSGGTYSITNNGAFGTMFTSPIINAPQVAILSTDAIRKRPAVVTTGEGEFIAPRLMGMVGQSFDHRAFDGAYSAAFLSRLKTVLENRDWVGELA